MKHRHLLRAFDQTQPSAIPNLVYGLRLRGSTTTPIGRTVGFISAKGGAGSSTVAHNVAWAVAQTTGRGARVVAFVMNQ